MTELKPSHTLLHISDTHFAQNGDLLHGVVDADAGLRKLLDRLQGIGMRPDALVFTGDLIDGGGEDSYRRLRAIVEPAAEALGAKVIWLPGNHDDLAPFRAGLLDTEPSTEPIDQVFDLNGLRIIAVDSSVPGYHHGDLTDGQFEWLADVLRNPAPRGSILALHHPPLVSPLELLNGHPLNNQDRLADLLFGTDVRAILAGHTHYASMSTFAGIPLAVASATCYTQDLLIPQPSLRGQYGGQSFNIVQVFDDQIVHSVVQIGDYETVYEYTAEQAAALAAGEH